MLHHKLIAGEIPGTYLVTELINEEDLLTIANQIARQKQAKGEAIADKHLALQTLQTLLQSREHEVFAMLFLDNQHRVLAYEELFHSTLSSASFYPREVVKRALALNVAALMLVHNHPSGHPPGTQLGRYRDYPASTRCLGTDGYPPPGSAGRRH